MNYDQKLTERVIANRYTSIVSAVITINVITGALCLYLLFLTSSIYIQCTIITYSMIVPYSRDHKGVGVAHKIISPKKTASIFPDDHEAVLVR